LLPDFRVFRPLNLLIVAGLCVVYYYFLDLERFPEMLENQTFWLLTLCFILVTAAGYLINDHFDRQADEINKPQKVYLEPGTHKGVWWTYALLNLPVVGLSFLFHPFVRNYFWLSIVLLYLYSLKWKHIGFLGNLITALLAGSLPILVFIQFQTQDLYFTLVFAIFSFVLTLIREWIKDIQDVEGDAAVGSRNLVQLLGPSTVRLFALVLSLSLLAFSAWQLSRMAVLLESDTIRTVYKIYVTVSIFLPQAILSYMLLDSKKFHPGNTSALCKYIMATGAGALFFL
jgi:4-hydroxybenzoate polyprenyltransferase